MKQQKILSHFILSTILLGSVSWAQSKLTAKSVDSQLQFGTSAKGGLKNSSNNPKVDFEIPADKKIISPKIKMPSSQKSNQTKQGGVTGTGGGNGMQLKDGTIVPLDVFFAEANRKIDVIKEYPVGYRYFRSQVAKISKAIPSFGKDVETIFSRLKWTLTPLELNDQRCLNDIGVFKLRAGDKQVVIACQKEGGLVVFSSEAVKAVRNPEHMGVIFLHEVFVYQLLLSSFPDSYGRAEQKMITEIMPSIISSRDLDSKELYQYAKDMGFISENNPWNSYALEVFEDRRIAHEKVEAERAEVRKAVAELKNRMDAIALMKREFEESISNFDQCPQIKGSSGTYIKRYLEVLAATDQLASDYDTILFNPALLDDNVVYDNIIRMLNDLTLTHENLTLSHEKRMKHCH